MLTSLVCTPGTLAREWLLMAESHRMPVLMSTSELPLMISARPCCDRLGELETCMGEKLGSKEVYREASRSLVKFRHPDWSPSQINAEARVRFEEAGRNFMEDTLKLGQMERPNGLWGYYGFPSCYNYYDDSKNYTGNVHLWR
ncbi:hypothetical protein INR49_029730 [Caranx melampygus]|nr:hypothetical protein INR49_029730 [Caranx melampygus]